MLTDRKPAVLCTAMVGTLLACCALVSPARCEVVLGVMGDSMSDEYWDYASFGSYASNWVDQLSKYGGVNVGPTAAAAGKGTWGSPRFEGYEYNWALAGATSSTVISGGQASGLAAQVPAKGLTHAILAIGANDFNPSGSAYQNIYNGTWSKAQIDSYVAGRLANMSTILGTVLPSGVGLAITNFVDYGVAPAVVAAYPDPVKRDRVTAVIQQVNTGIAQLALTNEVPLIDLLGVAKEVFGPNTNRNSVLLIGNVSINLMQSDTSSGGNPTAAFVHDGIHPNTTLQGLLANLYMTGLNIGYHADAPLFSEAEILAHRGIAYGGSDTIASQIGVYRDYITNYALPGDANSDGYADGGDYTIWADNYASTSGTWKTGDFTGDGLVDGSDYTLWADHYGPPPAAASAVPEPATLLLAVIATIALWGWRIARQKQSRRPQGGPLPILTAE